MKLFVAFQVSDTEYVVPADQVLHLESYEGATPIPGAAAYVAGLVQVRGKLVPVIDVRARFGTGGAAKVGDLDRRVIVVQHGARTTGLLVDKAREILKLDPGSFEPPPELVAEHASNFVTAIVTVGKRLLLLVDVGHIIGATAPEQEQTHA